MTVRMMLNGCSFHGLAQEIGNAFLSNVIQVKGSSLHDPSHQLALVIGLLLQFLVNCEMSRILLVKHAVKK